MTYVDSIHVIYVFKNIVYKENKIPNLPYKIMFL